MGLADVSGVKPASIYKGTEPVRFYGFQIHYLKKKLMHSPKKKSLRPFRKKGYVFKAMSIFYFTNYHFLLKDLIFSLKPVDYYVPLRWVETI